MGHGLCCNNGCANVCLDGPEENGGASGSTPAPPPSPRPAPTPSTYKPQPTPSTTRRPQPPRSSYSKPSPPTPWKPSAPRPHPPRSSYSKPSPSWKPSAPTHSKPSFFVKPSTYGHVSTPTFKKRIALPRHGETSTPSFTPTRTFRVFRPSSSYYPRSSGYRGGQGHGYPQSLDSQVFSPWRSSGYGGRRVRTRTFSKNLSQRYKRDVEGLNCHEVIF